MTDIIAERRQRWVDALRSGDYKQAKGVLKTETLEGDTAYCCLGVACELALPDLPELEWAVGTDQNEGVRWGFQPVMNSIVNTGSLPREVRDYYGIQDSRAVFKHPASVNAVNPDAPSGTQKIECHDLIDANDAACADFHQIANLIEGGHLK